MVETLVYTCRDGDTEHSISQPIRNQDCKDALGKLTDRIKEYRLARGPIPDQREFLFGRQGGLCHWCGVQCHLDGEIDDAQATRDHVHPRCLGGGNDLGNVVMACRGCNCLRGHCRNPIPTALGLDFPGCASRPALTTPEQAFARELLRRHLNKNQPPAATN